MEIEAVGREPHRQMNGYIAQTRMKEQSDTLPAPGHLPDINALIDLIRSMVGEVHPKWRHIHFTPHTLLDRDLGLDSLARMELRNRIERMFNVRLDEQAAVCACTTHDLMQAIIAQGGGQSPDARGSDPPPPLPNDPGTLLMGGYGDPAHVPAHAQRYLSVLGDCLYGLHAGLVVLALGLPIWLLVVVTPLRRWRTRVARCCARVLFKCTFTPFTVTGQEHLRTSGPMIVVANHTSYLDAVSLIAALEIPIRFIAKGELARRLPVRLILQRFGVEFIDRFNAHRGAMSVRRIARQAKNGESLVFFPEGTFISFPGLQPFRMGAFVAAVHSGAAVVPVAIRGARNVIGKTNWLPRRMHIEVVIRPPIPPTGEGWKDALTLRDAARREIGAWCGEPDLLECGGTGETARAEKAGLLENSEPGLRQMATRAHEKAPTGGNQMFIPGEAGQKHTTR
jgi:1-acyl-sn-glycerol-3-phosphate acyltransferase